MKHILANTFYRLKSTLLGKYNINRILNKFVKKDAHQYNNTTSYDRYPEKLLDEKVDILTHLVRTNGSVFFTHDPSTALARIVLNDNGRFGSMNNQSQLQAMKI